MDLKESNRSDLERVLGAITDVSQGIIDAYHEEKQSFMDELAADFNAAMNLGLRVQKQSKPQPQQVEYRFVQHTASPKPWEQVSLSGVVAHDLPAKITAVKQEQGQGVYFAYGTRPTPAQAATVQHKCFPKSAEGQHAYDKVLAKSARDHPDRDLAKASAPYPLTPGIAPAGAVGICDQCGLGGHNFRQCPNTPVLEPERNYRGLHRFSRKDSTPWSQREYLPCTWWVRLTSPIRSRSIRSLTRRISLPISLKLRRILDQTSC